MVDRIEALGIGVALGKTQALLFHGPRRSPPPGASIVVNSVLVLPLVIRRCHFCICPICVEPLSLEDDGRSVNGAVWSTNVDDVSDRPK